MWWLFLGHLAFGLATGLLTGMSQSPVVSAVLPLMFAFASGSVLALTVVGRATTDTSVSGIQLFAFAVGIIVGVFWGLKAGQLPLTTS